jgi:predicted dehydrogenase
MFDVLERKDIDTVLIATGDRWHALASILAMKAGKDVYSEKPCSRTIGEIQELSDTVKRYGRVFQAGTQRRSAGNFQFAAHLARSGRLGKIHTVHASISRLYEKNTWLPGQPEPSRDVCDWDRWLGPAPWRPFNQAYVDGRWRGYPDFDSGARLLDWGSHTVDLCQMALNMDGTTPLTYEVDPKDKNKIHAQYESGVKLIMRTFRREDNWMGLGPCPVRFEGDEGWVETGDSGTNAHPKSLLKDMRSFLAGRPNRAGHPRNFFNCVKSRAKTVCNADIARSSHIACYAAALSWTLGRKLRFDPVKEQFIGDDEANRMRSQAKRAPWHA